MKSIYTILNEISYPVYPGLPGGRDLVQRTRIAHAGPEDCSLSIVDGRREDSKIERRKSKIDNHFPGPGRCVNRYLQCLPLYPVISSLEGEVFQHSAHF
ncbi:MAG: hypothetical protein RBS55_05090 [Bacteroidales bacterium]|nr:hypothetical protein [Bacteroidales bacterium]